MSSNNFFHIPRKKVKPALWNNWRWQMKNRLYSLQHLIDLVSPHERDRHDYEMLIRNFPFRITPYYLSLIDWTNPDDPVKQMCLPSLKELQSSAGYSIDPLKEYKHIPVPGLIHRYSDRALILANSSCAIHCRHCNRKRYWANPPYSGSGKYLMPVIEYIKRHKKIREVIFSGGDTLLLPNDLLNWLLKSIRRISHVDVIRIGTRLPVVLPMRVNGSLCRILKNHRPLWINTHFNHPVEITDESEDACNRLLCTGIPMCNQSVFLKGVNDSLDTMTNLCTGLQKIMVKPYYLFICERVTGTKHFYASIAKAKKIIRFLEKNIGGLCVPRLVKDTQKGKVLI
ncbi:MAG: KamA family radical SAM protein [bacterium]